MTDETNATETIADDHTWVQKPAYRHNGKKFAHFKCSVCDLSKLEDLSPGDRSPWTFGHRIELWDGKMTCAFVQEQNRVAREAKQASIAKAIQEANEQEKARIAAGTPLPSQEERIRAAEKAADERTQARREQLRRKS